MLEGLQARMSLNAIKVLGLKFQAVVSESRFGSRSEMLSIVALGMNPPFLLETWEIEEFGLVIIITKIIIVVIVVVTKAADISESLQQ